jgi:autotransporter-associated beta strand protein
MSSYHLSTASLRRHLLHRVLSLVYLTVSATFLHAQLVWDANNTGTGQPNGAGQWLGTNQWWNGTANVNWDNSGSTIAQMGITGSALVSSNTVTITGGTANVGGVNFMGFSAGPGTGQQYSIAGSSGTLNFGAGGIINAADLSSTGSNFITFASTLLVTGSNLTIQKSGGTAQQFMRFDMVSNPGLTGTLTIKGNHGGVFFRSANPNTFAAVSNVVVESDSTFSVVTAGTYAMPISIAGTGGNGQYGAIRVDSSNITLAGPITMTANSAIQTNTAGVTGTLITGGISGAFGFTRFATGSGVGTLAFQSANTYTGSTTLGRTGVFAGGVTILDFAAATAPTDNILYNGVSPVGALNMIGGNNSATVLQLTGKAGTTNSQSFGNLTLTTAGTAGGTSVISLTSGTGGQMNLSLGTITRSASSTLAFVAPASGSITTTQADGFLGPWATYRSSSGVMNWARVTSGVVGAFSADLQQVTGTAISALAGYSSASHLELTDSSTGSVTLGAATTNLGTLTMNDQCMDRVVDLAGQTLRLGSTDATSTGGILLASDARNLTIGVVGSAGTVTSGGPNNTTAGQLYLTNASTSSTLTVNSIIANNSTGGTVTLFVNGAPASKVVLSGANTYTGGTTIASGVVEMKNAAALGTSGTVTLMEGAAIQLGGGINVTRAVTVGGQGVTNTGAIRNTAGNNSWTNTISLVAPTRFHSDQGTLTLTNSVGATSNILSGSHNVVFSGSGNHVVGSRLNITSATLTKEGSGMLTVSGDSGTVFTGASSVTSGVLRFASNNALSTSAITVNESLALGSALELTGGITVANAITFNGSGSNAGNGINGYGAIRNITGNNTLSGTLSIGLDSTGPRISADAGTTLTAATYITGITKIESGTVNLRGTNTFTPNVATPTTVLVNVRGGTLNLDYANATPTSGIILGTNNLGLGGGIVANGGSALGGGTLLMTGKATTINVQSFAGTTLAGGRSAITVVSGTDGTASLALGPITRGTSSGSAVNLTLPTSGSITTTSINSNGILNGGMTVGNNTWATSAAVQSTGVTWTDAGDTVSLAGLANGTQVSFSGTVPGGLTAGVGYYVVGSTGTTVQLAATEGGAALAITSSGTTATANQSGAITGLATGSYSTTFATNANVDVAGGAVSQAAITTNSLRFNATAGTILSLSGNLTNSSGGILITPDVTGDVTFQSTTGTARTLSSGTPADFTVHHHGSGILTFASTITLSNATGFTKTGTGTMTFAGTTASSGVQIRATEGNLNFVGTNQFTSTTDPTLFFGSATTSTKVSFGNNATAGSETLAGMYVLGSGSSLVGSGSAFFTLGLQSSLTTDLRNLMIGGSGTNENNLNFEAYSGGTVLMGSANSYAGRTNIGRAVMEASVIANAGVVSSLGTGTSSPDILMNDTTSTSATVSTLRYIGSADASTDRVVRLFTNGITMPSLVAGIENNGTGSLKFTSAFTVGGDTTLARTFRLSGTNAGANEIVSIGETATSVLTLDKAGTGTWALTGDSTYTGGTTVSNGTLQLGNGGTAGNVGSGSIAISSGATLRTNRSNTVEITNVITGSGNVVIANSGAGITKLSSNASTYTGGTIVSSGTLMVTNTSGSATGAGPVTVMSGATLAGSGRIAPAADVSVIICGTLAVGESASSASLFSIATSGTGALTLDGGSTLAFNLFGGYGLGDSTSTPASADLMNVGGTLQINPGAIFRVTADNFTGYAGGDQWKLIDWTTLGGTASGTFTTFDLPMLDGGLIWNTSTLYTLGTVSIVPEPSRAVLLLLGLGAALLRRRR